MVAGAITAFYQLGYGIAAFGSGPLQSAGASFSTIFGMTAVCAPTLGAPSFLLPRRQHRVSHLHPRPAPQAQRRPMPTSYSGHSTTAAPPPCGKD